MTLSEMLLGRLASHVAELPYWGVNAITKDDLDILLPDGSAYEVEIHATRAALLAAFDGHVAAMSSLLAGATDAQLMQPWSLKRGGATLFTMPKASVIRHMVLNHMIHHRAQLGVYLRLNDVPLPQMYGPSADELAF